MPFYLLFCNFSMLMSYWGEVMWFWCGFFWYCIIPSYLKSQREEKEKTEKACQNNFILLCDEKEALKKQTK